MYNPYESSVSDIKGGERINETRDKIFTEQSKFKGKNKKSNEYMSKEEPFTTNKTIKQLNHFSCTAHSKGTRTIAQKKNNKRTGPLWRGCL